jgi:hypothetical protein
MTGKLLERRRKPMVVNLIPAPLARSVHPF